MNDEEQLLENKYLKTVLIEIDKSLEKINSLLSNKQNNIIDSKKYIWENIYEMDHIEVISNQQSIAMEITNYEMSLKTKRLLTKMLDSPYFGCIDFVYDGEPYDDFEKYYIGIGGFIPNNSDEPLVYDWRAPISSMYYDYDVGNAKFTAPLGEITGEIIKKRQYKIKNGIIQYILDNNMTIDDDILQRELSNNTNKKMKNIVSTIQKEQNSIIRNESSKIMIVQGVAGSGKTSIALHRIAYLLYKNKDTLKSNNILIISPNNIFSDYISSVLPELGEENILEMSFNDIAKNELKGMKCESKLDQIEFILMDNNVNSDRKKSIDYKESYIFFNYLNEFIKLFETNSFNVCNFKYLNFACDKQTISFLFFEKYSKHPIFEKIKLISDYIADVYESDFNTTVGLKTRNEIYSKLLEYVDETDIINIYKKFLLWCYDKDSDLTLNTINDYNLYYEDIFPIVYLKFSLYGYNSFKNIKHLVIDEMQDYSLIHFAILQKIFNCKMTILGDLYQVLELKEINVLDILNTLFENTETIRINRSYRSTIEIANFAKDIINQSDVIPFERHGKDPEINSSTNYESMIEKIYNDLLTIDLDEHSTISIICKTYNESLRIYNSLKSKLNIKLFDKNSSTFSSGIIVTTSYLAKGLEFDIVLIPMVDNLNYKTSIDKQILYISCTRALHELKLYYFGNLTTII